MPQSTWSFVQFWRKSTSLADSKTAPVIVHCSNISGSTGVYIALDNLYTQALSEGRICPQEVLRQLQNQRKNMVQTEEQYVFLHEALADALHIRVKPIKTKDFEEISRSLLQHESIAGKTGFSLQYDLLFGSEPAYSELQHRHDDHMYSTLKATKDRSAYSPEQLPMGNLAGGTHEQPNTIHLQNYAKQNVFILTTVPTATAGAGLWSLIESRRIKTILSFVSYNEGQSAELPLDQGQNAGLSVQKLESKNENSYVVTSYAYKRKDLIEAEVKSVKHFYFLGWKDDFSVPDDETSLVIFLCALQRWHLLLNEAHPILLFGRSKYQRLSICSVLLGEFERIRTTGELNIAAAIKRMHDNEEQLIPNLEQYQFCHSAILEFIKQYDIYVNT